VCIPATLTVLWFVSPYSLSCRRIRRFRGNKLPLYSEDGGSMLERNVRTHLLEDDCNSEGSRRQLHAVWRPDSLTCCTSEPGEHLLRIRKVPGSNVCRPRIPCSDCSCSSTPRRAVECVSLRSGLCHPVPLAAALRPCSLVLRLFGLIFDPEGSTFLRNVCQPLPDYTMSHPS
jgi:hypothetical protein